MALLFTFEDVEVEVPKLDRAVVEAAEEVGIVEPKAQNKAVASVSAHFRLLITPDLKIDKMSRARYKIKFKPLLAL